VPATAPAAAKASSAPAGTQTENASAAATNTLPARATHLPKGPAFAISKTAITVPYQRPRAKPPRAPAREAQIVKIHTEQLCYTPPISARKVLFLVAHNSGKTAGCS
jgi:hypothetical protein